MMSNYWGGAPLQPSAAGGSMMSPTLGSPSPMPGMPGMPMMGSPSPMMGSPYGSPYMGSPSPMMASPSPMMMGSPSPMMGSPSPMMSPSPMPMASPMGTPMAMTTGVISPASPSPSPSPSPMPTGYQTYPPNTLGAAGPVSPFPLNPTVDPATGKPIEPPKPPEPVPLNAEVAAPDTKMSPPSPWMMPTGMAATIFGMPSGTILPIIIGGFSIVVCIMCYLGCCEGCGPRQSYYDPYAYHNQNQQRINSYQGSQAVSHSSYRQEGGDEEHFSVAQSDRAA